MVPKSNRFPTKEIHKHSHLSCSPKSRRRQGTISRSFLFLILNYLRGFPWSQINFCPKGTLELRICGMHFWPCLFCGWLGIFQILFCIIVLKTLKIQKITNHTNAWTCQAATMMYNAWQVQALVRLVIFWIFSVFRTNMFETNPAHSIKQNMMKICRVEPCQLKLLLFLVNARERNFISQFSATLAT